MLIAIRGCYQRGSTYKYSVVTVLKIYFKKIKFVDLLYSEDVGNIGNFA